ncbi:MAG: class I SAM-dependent methyltransferase [Candidatus Rokuibacteriota bacterium]
MAVEPERYLRERAMEAATTAPIPVRVIEGLAERLAVEAASFDAGVASLVLCSIADPGRALAEIFRVIRVIRLGGELRFYEHVGAERPGPIRLQRAVDALVWPRLFGGCHTSRETDRAVEGAGFVIESLRRFPFRPCPLAFPVAPHVIGRARRP